MTLLLTSSPFQDDGRFNPANAFLDNLWAVLPPCPRCLFVSAAPDDWGGTEHAAWGIRNAMELAGMQYDSYEILDRRTADEAPWLVANSDFIIFSGGHVPTQNNFYKDIDLFTLIKDFNGVAMGISAGSMNCAREVYSIPELNGEAVDPNYVRFFPGLGLTTTQIIPHYNYLRDVVLDGLRMFEDIAYPDSMHHEYCILMDGAYVMEDSSGRHDVYGEAYRLTNGFITPYHQVHSALYI